MPQSKCPVAERIVRSRLTAKLLRPISALALSVAVYSPTASVWAQPAASSSAAGSASRQWLMRIQEAATHHNFQGTFVVTGGGAASSARIAHFCEGSNQFERSETLDGRPRKVYRYNDVVATLWPDQKTATIEKRDALARFPSLLKGGDDHVSDFYDVRAQGVDRVAGRDANLLVVKPLDAYRFGYRLWADRASGLLLRADVIGQHDEVLESSAFSDVVIGMKPQIDTVLQPMHRLEGYRVSHPTLTAAHLAAEGWSMHEGAPGFREISCMRRPLEDAPDDGPGSSGPLAPRTTDVLQTIYSDGLTYVSVFIEPYEPRRHFRPMLASVGPTQTLMQQKGDWWVTVVGDVPPATLRLFAKGLERSKP